MKDLRIAAVTSLGFVGFILFSKLDSIQPNHIFFQEEFVKVFVPRRKTDLYREGIYVYISKLDSNYLKYIYEIIHICTAVVDESEV